MYDSLACERLLLGGLRLPFVLTFLHASNVGAECLLKALERK